MERHWRRVRGFSPSFQCAMDFVFLFGSTTFLPEASASATHLNVVH